ncbi:MAG: glycosyltransferase [Gemmatimonadota bacterium]|nr:glycosyltransferase [Gemmatimonadota bacterium]
MSKPPFRLLHVDSAREYRGGQNQVRALMAGLGRDARLHQELVAARGSRLAGAAADMGVVVRPVRWRSATDPGALIGLARAFREPWDAVHAHDSHALQLALLARSLVGRPAVLVAARRVDFPTRRPGVWRRANRILAVSRHIRDVLVRQGIERSRIDVVYSGIDPSDLEPRLDGVLRRAAGAGPDQVLVAAAGALVDHKDHATFVRAAALVADRWPDVRFAVFGEGPLRGALTRLVSEVGLEGRFRLPGEIAQAARSFGDIDIFVMPSREEGLGTACIEAMIAGVPIVATCAGGLGELAGEAFCPVEPGQPAALAGQMERLLADASVREAASARSRVRARAFSAETMVHGTLQCYAGLAPRSLLSDDSCR